MSYNYDAYKQIATNACREVFELEYLRSTGLPQPNIEFLLSDSPNFHAGEYYILIADGWQIHLKFGLLPESYKRFEQEVKVLTRHEIEHFMCCPYDLITQKRMELAILRTIERPEFKNLQLNASYLRRSLSNQIADIIIDSKLYFEHQQDTLDSEIDWIEKTTNGKFSDLPKYSRLFFLTKEKLWGRDLKLNEKDKDLIDEVAKLSGRIEDGGITNKHLFIEKTIAYTTTFLKLYQKDQNEKSDTNSLSNPLAARDNQAEGGQFVIKSLDALEEVMTQIAQEASINEFVALFDEKELGLTERDKLKFWFDANNEEKIPIEENLLKGSKETYSYPTTWRLGDPIEEIDMMLSYTTSPILIPGVTTKKWVQHQPSNVGNENTHSDLLLVIDSSGSMGSIKDPAKKMHQAVKACFGILNYFESKKANIALLNFSDTVKKVSWTRDYDTLKEQLLWNGSGGTSFPVKLVEEMIDAASNKIVTVVITDGDIQNSEVTRTCLQKSLEDGNKLYIFIQDTKGTYKNFQYLEALGAKVHSVINADDIRNSVMKDL